MAGRQRLLVIAALLGVVVAGVYWRVLLFPYVRDDWILLAELSFHTPAENLARIFSTDGPFFRPLGDLYVWLSWELFGLSTVGFHVADLLLHTGSAVLVIVIFRRLLAPPGLAEATAFLYAAAAFVHLDPLIWCVGIYDLGGAFCLLAALAAHLHGRRWLGAAAFAAGLLFKEATAVLPLVLLGWELARSEDDALSRRIAAAVRAVWPAAAVAVAYALIVKSQSAVQPFETGASHAYHMALFGRHVGINAVTYAAWSLEALFPVAPSLASRALPWIGVAALLVPLSGLVVLGRALLHPGAGAELRTFGFLGWWWLAALLPALLLTNRAYHYYLVYALPPFLGACLMLVRAAALRLGAAPRAAMAVVTVVVVSGVAASGLYVARRTEGDLSRSVAFGSTTLVGSARTVDLARRGLAELRPELPPNATLVFDGVPVQAFWKSHGPRVWYDDRTLRVFTAKDLGRDATGVFIRRINPKLRRLGATAPYGGWYLNPETTFYFGVRDGRLVEVGPDVVAEGTRR